MGERFSPARAASRRMENLSSICARTSRALARATPGGQPRRHAYGAALRYRRPLLRASTPPCRISHGSSFGSSAAHPFSGIAPSALIASGTWNPGILAKHDLFDQAPIGFDDSGGARRHIADYFHLRRECGQCRGETHHHIVKQDWLDFRQFALVLGRVASGKQAGGVPADNWLGDTPP